MSVLSVSVTHNGRTREVRCSQEQYAGTEYILQRTSHNTPFLRQVELFSGVSFRSQAMNDDRTIQRIADGIRDLQGFNEEDRENFRKQIILTSIDFDRDELRIVERETKNFKKSRHRKERTVKELWASVIEEPDTVDALEGQAQEITDFLDMVYPKGDSAQDGQKEDRLKKLRKIIHCLEEMEETIKRLREKVNTNKEVNSEGELKMEREKLLEAIQYVITFKKTMLAIFDAKKFPAANMDVEILSDSLETCTCMNFGEILIVWEIIKSMYNESTIQAIRRWLLMNVVFTLTVLLIDNSKSMVTKNKANAAKEFVKQFISHLKQKTDLAAIGVITIGGGPSFLEPFTLLENFNANSLDKIKFQGCTPLTTALIFCKKSVEEYMEKISSELKMDCIDVQTNVNGVMITDMLPTEWHNNFLNGIVSSPKDECQETSEEFGGMIGELMEAINKFLEDTKSSLVLVSLSLNLTQSNNIFRPEQKGYALDISSTDNPFAVLADYNLNQKYSSDMETIHTLTNNNLEQGKIIRGDDRPRAMIFQQLNREWEIRIGTKTLALSDRDNQNINIYLTELRTSRSKVLELHLDSKLRICRIIPKTKTRGISNGEDNSKHEAYNIKITSDSGELYTADLVRKRRVNY